MKTQATTWIVTALIGLTLIGSICLWWKTQKGRSVPVQQKGQVESVSDHKAAANLKKGAAPTKSTQGLTAHPVSLKRAELAGGDSMTNVIVVAADRAAADKMETWLDQDNHEQVLKLGRQLMHSKDSEVRSRVVDAFGWIGVKALPELTAMLGDEQTGLAEEAYQQMKAALDEITDDTTKADLVTEGMISGNLSQSDLEDYVMEFNSMSEDVAIRGLVKIIESSNAIASEVARDHYNFIAGEDYTTREKAEEWIANNVSSK